MNDTETSLPAAVAKIEAAAAFLQSPFLVAQLLEGMQAAVIRANSPWLTRKEAAEHARCSPSEIDRAASKQILKRYMRNGTPLYQRAEIDAAISTGKWTPAGKVEKVPLPYAGP